MDKAIVRKQIPPRFRFGSFLPIGFVPGSCAPSRRIIGHMMILRPYESSRNLIRRSYSFKTKPPRLPLEQYAYIGNKHNPL
ncbi:hypothetical protein RSAG8_13756, partial [Rhizoctonia solani AG-8 WAC10335]